jgi:hypothetical protein
MRRSMLQKVKLLNKQLPVLNDSIIMKKNLSVSDLDPNCLHYFGSPEFGSNSNEKYP